MIAGTNLPIHPPANEAQEAARRFWSELSERANIDLDLAAHELMEATHNCDWSRYDYLQRLIHNAFAHRGASIVGEILIASPYFSASDQRELALRHANWTVSCVEPQAEASVKCAREGPLRIGFLGADFYQQATSYLMVGLIEEHDRQAFHYIAYDYGRKDDSALRQRLIAAFDAFHEVGEMDNPSIAAMMRKDALDVLVYLRNPADPRAQIMALRPAPLRLAYLYNPGGFGAPLADYLVADAEVVPESLEHLYSEKIARLDQCYQPNDAHRQASIPTSRRQLGLPENRVVLANLGSPLKITPAIFDLWCAVLRARPDSVLWLLETRRSVTENLWREAHLRGVNPERLYFAPVTSTPHHLGRFACADVMVDTHPYGGHTLSSDALWAGVPVVTMRGESFASRVAASLLTEVGLTELITDNPQAYVDLICALVDQTERRSRLRAQLEQARRTSRLFDPVSYARNFEAMLSRLAAREGVR